MNNCLIGSVFHGRQRPCRRFACCSAIPLVCWNIFSPPVCAAQFRLESYLLAGTSKCVRAVGAPDRKAGDVSQFLIAVTRTRALSGWAFADGD